MGVVTVSPKTMTVASLSMNSKRRVANFQVIPSLAVSCWPCRVHTKTWTRYSTQWTLMVKAKCCCLNGVLGWKHTRLTTTQNLESYSQKATRMLINLESHFTIEVISSFISFSSKFLYHTM